MTENNKNNKKTFKFILQHLNILYIEDEINIRKNIKKSLELIVSNVYDTDTIEGATEILNTKRIDIIISDINLKKQNALEFIKDIRKNYFKMPVILLSAYTEKNYLLEATKLKLVDYLVKPIDFKILNNAIEKAAEEIIENGKYIIEFKNNTIYNVLNKELNCKASKEELLLTAKEIELLELLISNSNRIISYEEIKDSIWPDSFDVTDSALKNIITKLRKKIGKESIKNIPSIGFRLDLS